MTGLANRLDRYRGEAVKQVMSMDMVVLPLTLNDYACLKYRIRLPDSRIWTIYTPYDHWDLWGKRA